MKAILLVCFLAVAGVAVARPQDQYTSKYDGIDLQEILDNRRLLVPYLQCILDKGRCTPEGKELKSHIKEALENNCAKCTETQRNGTRKVLGHLINHEQDYWNQLKAKYDENGVYTKKYEDDLTAVKG